MTNSVINRTEVLQDRHGLKLASYLTLSAAELPHDISERLRAARVQALAQRKVERVATTAHAVIGHGGSAALAGGSGDELGWWGRIGIVMPLIALVVGMLFINSIQNDSRARELAEVDVALLTDELPPAAFSDPGFIQFLKATH